ncbi:HNH endonuclease signature motif containing protein [Streptomyces sp. NPDC020845]|uniref:HNH endonuclease signature motif containing protein n=1 Tax=Streptomyces sp. NPDC020845 TaxID=3365096 RepID=UPI00379413D6
MRIGQAMSAPYERERLATAVAESSGWTDLMRRLGVTVSGGRRRVLQRRAAEYGLDTSHFKSGNPWRKFSDEAIAQAVASSTTLREVAVKLGATPATGTLSHLRRRIAAAGIDVAHFPGLNRRQPDLPFTAEELREAVSSAQSIRDVARALYVSDDGRSRAALGRMLKESGIDTSHFRNSRFAIPEEALREAVLGATSFAEVMRLLGLRVDYTNHRRVRQQATQLGLDTSHFTRKTWGTTPAKKPKSLADEVLQMLPQGSPRANRRRLHHALQEVGVPYSCVSCGNAGTWLGKPITLQIDHANGDWLDNRRENLRYLCPNCHAIADTWCGRNHRREHHSTG